MHLLGFASYSNVICNSGVELSLFDKCHHNLIFGELNFMVPLPPAECIWRIISRVHWNFVFQGTSVSQKVMIFNKHLMNIFHNFIPNKIINCCYKRLPGMTNYIKSKLRERSKMSKKYYKYGQVKSHLDVVVCDLRSETKGSRFESGCSLCAEVSSLQ